MANELTKRRGFTPEEIQVFERQDDAQILAAMEGAHLDVFVYDIEMEGRTVSGLSYAGTLELARRKRNIQAGVVNGVTVPPVLLDTEDGEGRPTIRIMLPATDRETGNVIWGMAEEPKMMRTRKGEVADTKAAIKALSKAQRNAIRGLLPVALIEELINKAKGQQRKAVAVEGEAREVSVTGEEAPGQEQSQEAPQRGLCPDHNEPFQHRVGKKRDGGDYDFWACPHWEKGPDGKRVYCKQRPAPQAEATGPVPGGEAELPRNGAGPAEGGPGLPPNVERGALMAEIEDAWNELGWASQGNHIANSLGRFCKEGESGELSDLTDEQLAAYRKHLEAKQSPNAAPSEAAIMAATMTARELSELKRRGAELLTLRFPTPAGGADFVKARKWLADNFSVDEFKDVHDILWPEVVKRLEAEVARPESGAEG